MSVRSRFRSLNLLLVALFLLAVVATALMFSSRNLFQQQSIPSHEQSVMKAIRQRGATVVIGPLSKGGLADVIGVDLRRAVADAELMQMLCLFTEVQRVNLDGATLQPQDWELINKLPRLNNLSLARSNVSDADVLKFSPNLTSLTLRETAVTDKSMSRVAMMNGLINLDIAGTKVTPDGLRLLEPLRSLEWLWVSDSCIGAYSVEALRLMHPQSIEITISEGFGRRSYDLLSDCNGLHINARHRQGYDLWAADAAWSHTLAGVVEAVVSAIDLDSSQAALLLKILGEERAGWGPTVREPFPSPSTFSMGQPQDSGIEIATTEEFINQLHKFRRDFDYWGVRRFAREEFNADDVPQLLSAVRAAQYPNRQPTDRHPADYDGLIMFGPFLLVHHGIENTEARAELDRLLSHSDSFVRANTICAFGYGGAQPFYGREEWTSNKAADAFAVPRLLRICRDKNEIGGIRDEARMQLTEIAIRRPEYAAEVFPVLVDLLSQEGQWHTSPYNISGAGFWLAEVDAEAAIAVVPKLREMLPALDEKLADDPAATFTNTRSPMYGLHRQRQLVLETVSAAARHSPALAHEIALEYLSRLENGQVIGPFATLLSPDTPETNRMFVKALLGNANVPKGELASVARAIRDWKTTEQRSAD